VWEASVGLSLVGVAGVGHLLDMLDMLDASNTVGVSLYTCESFKALSPGVM
jgi:hypothetical protein